MGRLGLAWRVLTNGAFTQRIAQLLTEADAPKPAALPNPVMPPRPAAPPAPVRNDAITLLASLQREGRLIDFLKEPIDGYTDTQVGAAVRDIHRACAAVLERQFSIRPVYDQPEGTVITFGPSPDPGKIRLSGAASHSAAESGRLMHHGWQATACELPKWTGDPASARVIAPADVEPG